MFRQIICRCLKSDCKCITIVSSGRKTYGEDHFANILQKYSGETIIVSMHLAKDLLNNIDAVADATGHMWNEIMIMSLEFALEYMEIVMMKREKQNNGGI